MDDKSELIACIETGNFARAARIAAGNWAAFTLLLERTCALLVSVIIYIIYNSVYKTAQYWLIHTYTEF